MVIFFILGYHHLDTRTAVNRGAMRKEQSVKKSQGFLFSAKVRQLIHIFFLETRTKDHKGNKSNQCDFNIFSILIFSFSKKNNLIMQKFLK